MGAYSLPVIASILGILYDFNLGVVSMSILLLNLKLLLFLRAFKSVGKNLVIIIGVAGEVYPFLILLFLIIIGFTHAFYIILKPNFDYLKEGIIFNDDLNNPWNLVDSFFSINPNGTLGDATFIQSPKTDTSMFTSFPSSLLALFLVLTGNNFKMYLIYY